MLEVLGSAEVFKRFMQEKEKILMCEVFFCSFFFFVSLMTPEGSKFFHSSIGLLEHLTIEFQQLSRETLLQKNVL